MKLEIILLSDDIISSINNNIDYLIEIIPEIRYMFGFEHRHPHHHLDVWNHTLLALSLSESYFDIRLSLLLHDIGKPFSYQDEEVRHFRNHPMVSSQISRLILNRLGFDKEYIDRICFFIENHDIPISDELIKENKDLSIKLYKIQYCDALAHHPEKLEKRKEYLHDMKEKIYEKRRV